MDMDRLTRGFIRHKRTVAKQQQAATAARSLTCPLCDADLERDLDVFKRHVRQNLASHPSLSHDEAIEDAFKSMSVQTKAPIRSSPEQPGDQAGQKPRRPVSGDKIAPEGVGAAAPGSGRPVSADLAGPKKRFSPPLSTAQDRGSEPSTPNRSRARPSERDSEFDRGPTHKNASGRRLWTQDDKAQMARHQSATSPKAGRPGSAAAADTQSPGDSHAQASDEPPITIIRQPETRPIAQEQLVAEVKGIYSGLVMVESKCIEVDSTQANNTDAEHQLSTDQWQALIALHRTLLHEHHDFFLASQHPSASPALRRLAAKYAMPARMWRHGIHSFLELLRHKLPTSLEHMLTFIYLAYSMVALLYETVPTFEETWIECLGDLGRYRMAIEDDDIRDREIWTSVSQHWYSMASAMSPTTGRLYHHRAILARPNALQQLYYYAKSLCVPVPFVSARESVMTLFDPLLTSTSTRLAPIDAAFVRVHGILFSGKAQDQLKPSMEEFLSLLDGHIGRTTKRWLESGYYIGIVLGCSLLGYGDKSSVLMRAIQSTEDVDYQMDVSSSSDAAPGETYENALGFAVRIYDILLRRWGDMNTLPCLHVTLVFLYYMAQHPAAMAHIEKRYPWKLTAVMLNSLFQSGPDVSIDSEEFPGAPQSLRPLPEDYALNGLVYSDGYFPSSWFSDDKTDDEEKCHEAASMVDDRRLRILWLGRRLASLGEWLAWDSDSREFSVVAEYDVDVEMQDIPAAGAKAPLPTTSGAWMKPDPDETAV